MANIYLYNDDTRKTITAEGRKVLRHLVDIVWQHIWEDQSVPSTAVADDLIDKALLTEIRKNKDGV